MEFVFEKALECLRRNEDFVLAAVLAVDGSAPRDPGSKMLIFRDGKIEATIGGGLLEGKVISAAEHVLETGRSLVMDFIMNGSQEDLDIICGGTVRVMLSKITQKEREVFGAIVDALAGHRDAYFVSCLKDGNTEHFLVETERGKKVTATTRDSRLIRKIKGIAFGAETPTSSSGEAEIYVEHLFSDGKVYLFGGGHVAYATEAVARIAGFSTVVVDDRAAFASSKRFPYANCIVLQEFEGLERLAIDKDDYLVIVTRAHVFDYRCLAWAVSTSASYIGMIGSAAKRRVVYNKLRSMGVSDDKIGEIHSPLGIALGGKAPGEIAVGIVAELIQVRSAKR
jgi:xanthine dehydrogenase accessory factor